MGFRVDGFGLKKRVDCRCGFAGFENTVDPGSAVNFGADSGLCLS